MGSYIASTPAQQREMLDACGAANFVDLYEDVPADMLLNRPLEIPNGMSELEVANFVERLAAENIVFRSLFRGAGAYKHYIPAIVRSVTGKEEFVTAYTPYQAEVSQGLLQGIFEFQTMICELTGMDVANASVYDGASAAAEATVMCRERNRQVIYVAATVHPDTLRTIKTYSHANGAEVVEIPAVAGKVDAAALAELLDKNASCVVLQQPNYFGLIEDAAAVGELAHAVGAKYIISANPISLGILKTPAEYGADIAVGEGQPLGMPLAFGGPYLGFMACKQAMLRKLPGRIVGETTDNQGERAYVLTLQAREQHIRREKASSSICSNQAHCALTACVYLSALGAAGLQQVAEQCHAKAVYTAGAITAVSGFELLSQGDFFNEFITTCPVPTKNVLDTLAARGILGGLPIQYEGQDCLLWCVTEVNTKMEIDIMVSVLKGVAQA